MPFGPPVVLVAALLTQVIYHDPRYSTVPPSGWEKVSAFYDSQTGYYGEAWGELAAASPGSSSGSRTYDAILQVNRGTIFPANGPNIPPDQPAATSSTGTSIPAMPLRASVKFDSRQTLLADIAILSGNQPRYILSAVRFHDALRREFGKALPIVETGQSLGGATADAVIAIDRQTDAHLSAITFNALAYGNGNAGIRTASAATLPVVNYYVANEWLTRNFVVRSIQWLTCGRQIGQDISLPRLAPHPHSPMSLMEQLTAAHLPTASLPQVFRALYDDPVSPLYTHPQPSTLSAALQWLMDRFPDPAKTHKHILSILNGLTAR